VDAQCAFDVLAEREAFTEEQAIELAEAFGVVFDHGPSAWRLENNQRVYSRATLEHFFRRSLRCRPIGEISDWR
jgi:hypothetical protein